MNVSKPPTNALRLAIAVAGLGATLLIAGTAEARITKISVGVSGTQTTHSHVVVQDAAGSCADPTGDMSESFSLRTYRRQILAVLQGFRSSLGFDPQFTKHSQEILTRGTITRTSTLTADGRVSCGANNASCGTRSFARLELSAAPANSSRGHFQGIGIDNATNTPRDPFSACPGPLGGSLLFPEVPARPSFRAPIPASFLKSCRHGTMTRPLDGTVPNNDPANGITGATTVHLRVTVTQLGCLRGIG
jgi:hypothetical protein